MKNLKGRKMSDEHSELSFHQLDLKIGTNFSLPNEENRERLGSLEPYEMKNGMIEPYESRITKGKQRKDTES